MATAFGTKFQDVATKEYVVANAVVGSIGNAFNAASITTGDEVSAAVDVDGCPAVSALVTITTQADNNNYAVHVHGSEDGVRWFDLAIFDATKSLSFFNGGSVVTRSILRSWSDNVPRYLRVAGVGPMGTSSPFTITASILGTRKLAAVGHKTGESLAAEERAAGSYTGAAVDLTGCTQYAVIGASNTGSMDPATTFSVEASPDGATWVEIVDEAADTGIQHYGVRPVLPVLVDGMTTYRYNMRPLPPGLPLLRVIAAVGDTRTVSATVAGNG